MTWSRLLLWIHILNGKQCRSRSVGFWRSQLIWIYTVCKGRVCSGSAGQGLKIEHEDPIFLWFGILYYTIHVTILWGWLVFCYFYDGSPEGTLTLWVLSAFLFSTSSIDFNFYFRLLISYFQLFTYYILLQDFQLQDFKLLTSNRQILTSDLLLLTFHTNILSFNICLFG